MTSQVESAWSTDRIIEDIYGKRTTFIQELLQHNGLAAYLEEQFDTVALSVIKTEFLKRDLKQLADSTLDLVHYSMLIRKAKETDNWPDVLTIEEFVRAEIRTVVVRYIS
ncbi:MAG: hypothetical protein KIT62_08550 [Cyclobacteriaceae bacterium]|nr:hypothetical protein [Cyclobacteriaceae bacterium]